MKVFISGGTGFIGSRLAVHCLGLGNTVCVLGQENTKAEAENVAMLREKGALVVLGSVADQELLCETMQGVELVVHLAAAQHETNVPDQHFWNINVAGTKNMLEAAAQARVKRFVHGSTIGVYGSEAQGILDEESPTNPSNIYGITKLAGEKLVRSYEDRLPVVVVRISETYGPGDYRLLKLFRGVQRRRFPIIGDGQNMHHLVYIDDLIQGLMLASQVESAVGKTFVLPGKEPVTTNQMVKTVADVLKVKQFQIHAPMPLFWSIASVSESVCQPLGIHPPIYRRRMDFFRTSFFFSLERARTVLGYEPCFSFREGVIETAKWYAEKGFR